MKNNKKQFDFNWVVGGLADYTNQTSLELISKAVLSDPTAQYVQVMPAIKSAEDIHTIESSLNIQSGSAGFGASGSTTLGKVTLSVCKLKINEILDPYALEAKYTQLALNPGSLIDYVPFEQAISEEKAKAVAKQVAKIYWQGDTVSGTGNLALCNGLIVDIHDDNTHVVAATGATAWNATNIISSVQSMISAQNVDVLDSDSRVMFMSPAYYQKLTDALFNGNFFHVPPDTLVDGQFFFPGTNVRIVRTFGLQGSGSHNDAINSNDCVLLCDARYIYWGTDLVSDYSTFEIFYSKDNDEVRFISRLKIGAAHLFGLYTVANF
jgi:hypothetical protein